MIKMKIYNLKKLIRFISIYGISRTTTKAMGRLQISLKIWKNKPGKNPVSIIGCGQFAYSTICYFLRGKNIYFQSCFDIDKNRAECLSKKYNFKDTTNSFESVLECPNNTVYIASNHCSHTEYATLLLKKNINVYIEKPISVNEEQLNKLLYTCANSRGKVFAGYNRPFSQAIIDFKNISRKKGNLNTDSPFTINCYISGHLIPKDHWYRDPKEGLRICGNVGHWLDLVINLFNWRGKYPDELKITISYSNTDDPDDNIAINIVSDKHDLISIVLSSRSEPFEGINENINIQCGNVTAKIDDFRKMILWIDDILIKKNYWPKDVGHKKAIMQPFGKIQRDWKEVELSTLIMLLIKDMVLCRESHKNISIIKASETISTMREGKYMPKEILGVYHNNN